jgi:hypothetical protein
MLIRSVVATITVLLAFVVSAPIVAERFRIPGIAELIGCKTADVDKIDTCASPSGGVRRDSLQEYEVVDQLRPLDADCFEGPGHQLEAEGCSGSEDSPQGPSSC